MTNQEIKLLNEFTEEVNARQKDVNEIQKCVHLIENSKITNPTNEGNNKLLLLFGEMSPYPFALNPERTALAKEMLLNFFTDELGKSTFELEKMSLQKIVNKFS